MIIDDALFGKELNKLNSHLQNSVNFKYEAEFITENNKIINVHNVNEITILSNFVEKATDETYIFLQMFKSEYFKLLKTNRKILSLKLTKTQISHMGNAIPNGSTTSKVYDANLVTTESEAIQTRIGKLTGTEIDNLGALQDVTVQLIEKGFTEFKTWDVPSGVYKNCDITKLITSFMSLPLKTLDPTMKKGFGCTVYPVDNKEKFYQRIIKQGIEAYRFPRYMQDTRGVYGNGLGSYLFNGIWYIFPIFNVKRYLNDINKLTIINVPKNEMVSNNNSYYLDKSNKELYIFATGDTKHIDVSDAHLNTTGVGFKATNSNNLLNGFNKKVDGVLTIPKGQNTMDVTFDSRNSDFNKINTKNTVTGNRYKEASKITKGMTNTVIIAWEYSDLDLLYPGMPFKFIYKNNDKPYLLYGVLGGVQTTVEAPQKSSIDFRYKSTSILTLITERASN